MYSIKNQYPGAILAYNRPRNVQSYQEFFLPYISSFDPSFLFIQGDSTPYHSTGRQGVFLLATLPIFTLGIFKIAQKKDPMQIFILLTFFLTPLLYGLAASFHRGSRLLVLLPLYTIITCLGFFVLLNIKNHWVRFAAVLIVMLMVIFNYVDFVRDYWYEYPKRVKSEFAKPYQLVFQKAYNLSKIKSLNLFIQSDFRDQNKIAVDFFSNLYFPGGLKLWDSSKSIPEKSIIIVPNFTPSQKKDISQEMVGDGDFGILINTEKKK